MKTKSGLNVNRRLRNMPYADAGIIEGDGTTNLIEALISYKTIVGVIFEDGKLGKVLSITGLYSRTTIKHISAWCREHDVPYAVAKKCVTDRAVYSFDSKEFYPVTALS